MIMYCLKESLPIVVGADDNFAMPLGVTIFSILKNLNPETRITFYILDGGIKKNNKKKILKIINDAEWKGRHTAEWINPDTTSVDHLPKHDWMSEATYLRLLIPDILPDSLKKVIYLDCDLILETDITELWNYDINDTVIGAAVDVFVQTLSHSTGVVNYEKYGGHAHTLYFNTGVMLINLERWRQEEITREAIDYLMDNSESFTLHEQEALNAALVGKWKELDPRWNQQGSVYWPQVLPDSDFTKSLKEMYGDLMNNPYIIHYLSQCKPWDYKCMHPTTCRFLFYLKESGWFSSVEWKFWWGKYYYNRLKWLTSDLKQTLNMVRVRSKSDLSKPTKVVNR